MTSSMSSVSLGRPDKLVRLLLLLLLLAEMLLLIRVLLVGMTLVLLQLLVLASSSCGICVLSEMSHAFIDSLLLLLLAMTLLAKSE